MVPIVAAWIAAIGPSSPSSSGSPGFVDEEGSAVRVTFIEALRAGEQGPAEAGLREAWKVRQRGDARIRGLPDSLQVGVYPGFRLTPSDERGPQVQLQVTQPIALERLGRARRAAASAERQELLVAADALRLERRLDVARAWLDRWALQEQLRSLDAEWDASTTWVEDTEKLVEAGEFMRTESALARAWQTEVDLERQTLHGHLHHAGLRLATWVGESGGVIAAEGEPPSVALEHADLERLERGAEHLPAVVRLRLAAATARAREVELRAEAGWKLDVGMMLQVDQPGPAVGMFGQLGLEVPLWGRDERGRSAARAEAVVFDGQADEQVRAMTRSIHDALHELRHTEAQRSTLKTKLVPALTELVELEEQALRAGESTNRRVIEARRALHGATRRWAEIEGEYAWARLRVWLLISALTAVESER